MTLSFFRVWLFVIVWSAFAHAAAAPANMASLADRLDGHTFPIDGYFVHIGSGTFDWYYVPHNVRQTYKLEGLTEDGFIDWTQIEHACAEPTLYSLLPESETSIGQLIFSDTPTIPGQAGGTCPVETLPGVHEIDGLFIHFDTGSFDFIYISSDRQLVAKLDGMDDDGNFVWTFLSGQFEVVAFEADTVTFHVTAPASSSASSVAVSSAAASSVATTEVDDIKYGYRYEGMTLYAPNMSREGYTLTPLDDQTFNALDNEAKLQVADKLLGSLYYGMPYEELQAMVDSGTFISTVWTGLQTRTTDLEAIETELLDTTKFETDFYQGGEIYTVLARLYLLDDLDRTRLDLWSAYVLTQTIMFSPAYELESSHFPNIERIYNRLFDFFRDDISLSYSVFLHMISDDNWRRFRSPEDNGREMMEIFWHDMDDSHVPVAGQALKNWSLASDSDTLVVGLDENTEPLSLQGRTFTNGYDFYTAIVTADPFVPTVIDRLAEIYFPDRNATQRAQIVETIAASAPQTWQDILLQILFSETYLLDTERVKSAEELFYAAAKKLDYKHMRYTFAYFAESLDEMHQSSMRYKIGKTPEVPLDTLSFLTCHKYFREQVLLQSVWPENEDDYDWGMYGWRLQSNLGDDKFVDVPYDNDTMMLQAITNRFFLTMIGRSPSDAELALFDTFFFESQPAWFSDFNEMYVRDNAARTVLDYLSRLSAFYTYAKVAQ